MKKKAKNAILFYTGSAKHIADKIRAKVARKGRFIIKRFSDGEIYVKILESVRKKKVWVLASTFSPAENIIELLFLLDALKREGVRINLLIPYFGYARQDRVVEKGECLSAEVICRLLRSFNLRKIIIIEMHSPRLKKFLRYKNIVPYDLFSSAACSTDVIVAPDKGALDVARKVSRACRVSFASIEKFRPRKEKVKIVKITGDVRGKRAMIIDDMIAGGGTAIEACKRLLAEGAKEVNVIATHGLFVGDAIKKLEKSKIKRIYVTDSLPQKARSRKIRVIGLARFVEKIIKKG